MIGVKPLSASMQMRRNKEESVNTVRSATDVICARAGRLDGVDLAQTTRLVVNTPSQANRGHNFGRDTRSIISSPVAYASV